MSPPASPPDLPPDQPSETPALPPESDASDAAENIAKGAAETSAKASAKTSAKGTAEGADRPVVRWGLAVLFLTLVWLGWQNLESHRRMDLLEAQLAALRQRDGDAENRLSQSQAALESAQGRLAVLEARQAEAQSQQMALESLYQELSRSRDERLLAEIEQSLTIAAQQLQLAGNVETALIALQGADARLARSAQPQWLPLRKRISGDIARLKALPLADISGVALRLEGLANQVDTLPLAFEQKPSAKGERTEEAGNSPSPQPPSPAAGEAWWRAWGRDLGQEFRQLVRIERGEKNDPVLLAPNQRFFLRENLKLRLINARLALLSRDGRSFRDDVKQAESWLSRYFDLRQASVQDAAQALHNLGSLDLARDLPSLDDTLSAVRSLKLGRERR